MLPGVSRKFLDLGNLVFPRILVILYFQRSRKHFSEIQEIFLVLEKMKHVKAVVNTVGGFWPIGVFFGVFFCS